MLSNLTGHTLQIHIMALNAYSGPEGIFYQSPLEVDTRSYGFADARGAMAQYIDTADTILLVAGMSAILSVNVTVPDLDEGVLLGGIRITAEDGTREDLVQSIDTAFEIDLPSEAEPSVVAGDLEVAEHSIIIPVVNQSAAIAENVSAAYQIQDETGAVVLEGNIALPEMAPLTEYRVVHPCESWEMGAYTLHMQVSMATDFTLPFTVGAGGASVSEEPAQATEPAAEVSPETQQAEPETEQPAEQETQPPSPSAQAEPMEENPATSDAAVPIHKVFIGFIVFGIPAVFVYIVLRIAILQKRKRGRPKHRAVGGAHRAQSTGGTVAIHGWAGNLRNGLSACYNRIIRNDIGE